MAWGTGARLWAPPRGGHSSAGSRLLHCCGYRTPVVPTRGLLTYFDNPGLLTPPSAGHRPSGPLPCVLDLLPRWPEGQERAQLGAHCRPRSCQAAPAQSQPRSWRHACLSPTCSRAQAHLAGWTVGPMVLALAKDPAHP